MISEETPSYSLLKGEVVPTPPHLHPCFLLKLLNGSTVYLGQAAVIVVVFFKKLSSLLKQFKVCPQEKTKQSNLTAGLYLL